LEPDVVLGAPGIGMVGAEPAPDAAPDESVLSSTFPAFLSPALSPVFFVSPVADAFLSPAAAAAGAAAAPGAKRRIGAPTIDSASSDASGFAKADFIGSLPRRRAPLGARR